MFRWNSESVETFQFGGQTEKPSEMKFKTIDKTLELLKLISTIWYESPPASSRKTIRRSWVEWIEEPSEILKALVQTESEYRVTQSAQIWVREGLGAGDGVPCTAIGWLSLLTSWLALTMTLSLFSVKRHLPETYWQISRHKGILKCCSHQKP